MSGEPKAPTHPVRLFEKDEPPAGDKPASAAKPAAAAPAGAVHKLSIKGLDVTYVGAEGEPIEAVRGVDIEVPDKAGVGEIIVLLGPSGCGKSTILKCIAGLLRPTRGEVLVAGQPVDGVGRERGMVFQAYTSFGWLTVAQNVEYGLKIAGVAAGERRDQVEKYLRMVGLWDFRDQYPKSLSGGMKQRVAIARTLVNRPKLVLMDEPFGALDPQTRWEMQTSILEISRKEDNTIVLVTHDVSEAVYVADTCYVMAPRPTKVLHKVDVPDFGPKTASLKAAPEFRAVEKQLLDMLYSEKKS